MKKKGKRRSANDWEKFKNLYQTGQKSLKNIADEFKVNYKTLRSRASRENWAVEKDDIRNKIATKTQQKTVENLSDENAAINRMHIDFATRLINIAQDVAGEVRTNILKISEQAAALRALANMLESAQKVHRVALDKDEEYQEPPITVINNLDITRL